jgi:putative zinc finger/helix-turn-helix YgiT family protein
MVEQAKPGCSHKFEVRRATPEAPYQFIDSGLPNVYLIGISYRVCAECDERCADIPAVKDLMTKIARAVVEKESPLSGAEIRFLRKRLGRRSSDFARIIGVSKEQVSRWENSHNPPEASADKLMRIYYSHLSKDKTLLNRVDKHIEDFLKTLPGPDRTTRICVRRAKNSNWTAQSGSPTVPCCAD